MVSATQTGDEDAWSGCGLDCQAGHQREMLGAQKGPEFGEKWLGYSLRRVTCTEHDMHGS